MDKKGNELWRESVLPLDGTIQEVVQNLEKNSLRIVLIVNAHGVLVGTITDGDIRRGLLQGLTLNSQIRKVVNDNPICVDLNTDSTKVSKLMRIHKINHIPIVSENHKLVGLHVLDNPGHNTISKNSTLLVIMAGGEGRRLLPLTLNCPKPMLQIAGRPILEHIISNAYQEGFQKILISVNYLGNLIEKYFKNGSNFGLQIEYLKESLPLGTIGALSLINPKPESTFIVMNGDIITNIKLNELLEFHKKNGADLTVAVREQSWQNPYGVINIKDLEITEFIEKPTQINLINAGIYVMEPFILELLEKSVPCDLPSLIERVKAKFGKVIAFPLHETWLDIGNPLQFQQAQNMLIEYNHQ